MGKYFKWKILLILAVIGGSVWASYPPEQKINLGLDLKGGIHMLLQVDTEKIPEKQREGAVDRAVEIIRNRIDEFGVKEPSIIKQGKEGIVVQLPGLTDEHRAKDIVSKTAHLEFKIVSEDANLLEQARKAAGLVTPEPEPKVLPEGEAVPEEKKDLEKSEKAETEPKPDEKVSKSTSSPTKEPKKETVPAVMPEGYELKELEGEGDMLSQTLLLEANPILTGEHLTNAVVGFDQYGQAIVEFELDKEGAKIFDDVTFRNIGKRLAIVLDGNVHSAPVIRDRIPGGRGQISGNFTPAQASDLALVLRAGALPAPVRVIEQRTVGPTLGRDSIEKGIKAALGGAALVILFMIIYYRVSGLIASVAVFLNLVILVGFMALSGASLTLPGIAGIILTIGMAVDANVLISERMREEVRLGKAVRSVISAGYHKAFSAIFDSNVTTVLAAGILMWFGTGPIRGFSVTLMFGLLASFFTALFVTRVVFDFLTRGKNEISLKMFELIKQPNFDWISKRFFGYAFSIVLVGLGLFAIFARGERNLGIDFTGGSLQEVHLNQPPDLGKIRAALEQADVPSVQLQSYGDAKDQNIIVRSKTEDTKPIFDALTKVVGSGNFEVRRSDTLGPAAGKELFQKGVKAIALSLVLMLIYIWYRFHFRFGFFATLMVFHDSIAALGIYLLSGREFSLQTVAAILTIIGFSVNDTIVIYDRARENAKLMRKLSPGEIFNLSINQCFGRSILTTLTTMLVVVSLFLFGGPALNDFAFILLVGFGIGVYSTVFVAGPLIVDSSPKS
ncbi:MAG: protein translocase subunit SecD [Candidatus Omnitrophica bacterium]|nr:protein translocase subunit SecD [Candidatus Omnitrophota bacterium]